MSESSSEIRALRRMVKELGEEEPKEIAWDDLEAKLMSAIERDDAPKVTPLPKRRSRLLPVLTMAAAAAAAIVLLGMQTLKSPGNERASLTKVDVPAAAPTPAASDARGDRDLFTLHAGDVIESADAPVTYGHEGMVRWTLAPHGRLVVRSLDQGDRTHTVHLESGSIRAEVTPRANVVAGHEPFVVEVEGTRAAVRGTAFSVTRVDGRVDVDVEHGTVAVGPTGEKGAGTEPHLLVGPKKGSFTLDGRPHEHAVTAPAGASAIAPTAAPATATAAATASASAPASAAAPATAAAAAPAPALLTSASVRAQLAQCFSSTYPSGSASVHVSIASTLTLALNADGTVKSARFDPPLKPEFQACAASAFKGRFAEGERALTIPVSFGDTP